MTNLQKETNYPQTSAKGTMKYRVRPDRSNISMFVSTSTKIEPIKTDHASCLNECTASEPILQISRYSSVNLRNQQIQDTRIDPLSREEQIARRPPPPVLLLQANQDRPYIPANARLAPGYRIPRDKGTESE